MDIVKKFFKAGFSVDCTILGFNGEHLKILLIKRGASPFKDYWALPGNLVGINEDLDEAAYRVLKELTGLEDIYLEQVKTFGNVNRHPSGRVITVSYFALINSNQYHPKALSFATETKWVTLEEALELDMAFDHKEILLACLKKLQYQIKHEPIGFELLPEQFTLTALQTLYECIMLCSLDKRNFRKRILSLKVLRDTGLHQEGVAHRPAKLYSFDPEAYQAKINTKELLFF